MKGEIMDISLNEKEVTFLKELASKQYDNAKDNVGTATPIHVVERIRKEFVVDGSEEIWVDVENEYKGYDSFEDLIEARQISGENIPTFYDVQWKEVNGNTIIDEKDYCEEYGLEIYTGRYVTWFEPIAFFLVLDEAKRYKNEYQSHNCGDCRIYTYGLGYSNNGDLPIFRELLMKMGKQLLSETE